jgi:glycosyltransferase involved in cell wall biosynthesis
LKVLITIFEELVPLSGGGTPRISNIVKAFVKEGHEVYVAASIGVRKSDAIAQLGCVDIKPLFKVSRMSERKMIKYMYTHPLNILRLISYANRLKPDLIVSHNSIAGFGALLTKKIKNKKCITVLDLTDLLFEYLEDYGNWMKYIQKVGRKIELKTILESDKIVTISNSMKNILLDLDPDVKADIIDIVYDGVDTKLFKPVDSTGLRQKFGINAENIVIFQGVIDPQDHPEILVDAAKLVLKVHPDTLFWIVGDGTAILGLKKKVSEYDLNDKFYFFGWVRQEDVHKYISASDIGLVILPDILSARGRLTLKEFEYWACGVPAIVPRLPALEEVVDEGETGMFYEPGNYRNLADTIISLFEDEKMRLGMGNNGINTVKEKYEWEKLADQFVEISEESYQKHETKKGD